MIINRYIPFDDEPDPFDAHELISKIGEMMMRYQLSLNEAIENLIASGQAPNMFLKQVGFNDFIQSLIDELENKKRSILEKYDLDKNRKEIQSELNKAGSNLAKGLKKINISKKERQEILDSLDSDSNLDALYKLLWQLKSEEAQTDDLSKIIEQKETIVNIKKAQQRFDFSGVEKVPEELLSGILKELLSLDETIQSFKEAIENGDFLNFDPRNLRQVFGEEKYQEFLELQENLSKMIREALEKGGFIDAEGEGPSQEEGQLSSKAVQYLSSRALKEVYSTLQDDGAGMNHSEFEEGLGENTTSRTRSFEFGDSFSNIDWTTSIINSQIKKKEKPKLSDLEVYTSKAQSKNSIVILLDMSGSMYRDQRFYYAKKMTLALDRLMKMQYPLDKLEVVGFGSLARRYSLNELLFLQPFPVLFSSPVVRLTIPLQSIDENNPETPLYFTNLQRGLSLARRLLGSSESKNKQIFLITYGVPTAHIEKSSLKLNYPPTEKDFEAALQEANLCAESDITINTFLLTSDWWESFSGERIKKKP